MSNGKKYWKLSALVPDTIAFEVMALIANGKGLVEHFVPALTGPQSENGHPTSKITGKEFIAEYIAEHPHFTTRELSAAAAEVGLNKGAINAAVYALKDAGALVHTGPGRFSAKGSSSKKANGAAKQTRAPKGAAEAAVLSRINRAHGAAVSTADLAAALAEGGGSAKSISGVLWRLTKAKKIKPAEEPAHYVAA